MNVAIVGLGLIGSSLGWQLQSAGVQVSGYARKETTLKKAKTLKIISRGSTDLQKAIYGADLIIIALPVELIPETVHNIDQVLKHPAVVIDVGSVKRYVMDQVYAKKLKQVTFVGAHPMAGSEKVGIDNFVKNLFNDRPFIFTYPSRSVKKKTEPQLKQLTKLVKSNYIALSADEHDKRVAVISHLPYMVAVQLYNRFLPDKKTLEVVASSGFRDTTRVSHSDPLWGLMVAGFNADNIIHELDLMIKELSKLKGMIQEKKLSALQKRFNVDQVMIDPTKLGLVKKQITDYH